MELTKLGIKKLSRENIKISILIGMLFTGLSQLVFILAASKSLPTIDLARLISWTALITVASVAIGSPLVSLVALDVNAREINASDSITTRFSQAGTIALAVGFFTSTIWIFEEWGQLQLSSYSGILMLLISGFVQALSGIQRGLYLSKALWGKTSLQLSIEGVIRIGIALYSVSINVTNLHLFIFGSALAPLLSFLVMCSVDSNLLDYLPKKVLFDKHIGEFQAFWATSISLHGMISFSPSLFALRGASSDVVAAFGLGLYIVRTPITVSNSFIAPMFQRFTLDFGLKNFTKAKLHLFSILFGTVICFCIYTVFLWRFGAKVFLTFSENSLITDATALIAFGVVSMLFVVAIELGMYLTACGRLTEVSIGWLLGLIVFIATGIHGDSLLSVSMALTFGTLTTNVYFLVCVIRVNRMLGLEERKFIDPF